MKRMAWSLLTITGLLSTTFFRATTAADDATLAGAKAALDRAITYYHTRVASHGGYVYHYAADLSRRWGEGEATADQIWVQPPGTPTVGMAFLRAYEATGRPEYLQAATDAAQALVYGQITTGGWTNCIDFDPKGDRVAQYRKGHGKGRNISSLDDGQTQSAILLLMQADQALQFRNPEIHEAAQVALDALLAAQFPNGGFPQVWTGPATQQPVVKANYPDYDWRTENRIKNYWDLYTLNDNTSSYVAETLIAAHEIYQDERFLNALKRLGDFLILAQMPEPQPGWAQQYNYAMQPAWARKFEPPAVAGRESQDAILTLIRIAIVSGDKKYLEPIPTAIAWLKRSRLPDGQIARYYELRTNRPLYMERQGDVYSLTYDDSDLPDHYGWKSEFRNSLEPRYEKQKQGRPFSSRPPQVDEKAVRRVIAALDEQGRWVSIAGRDRLVGQPKFPDGFAFLSSQLFSDNVTLLSDYLKQSQRPN